MIKNVHSVYSKDGGSDVSLKCIGSIDECLST